MALLVPPRDAADRMGSAAYATKGDARMAMRLKAVSIVSLRALRSDRALAQFAALVLNSRKPWASLQAFLPMRDVSLDGVVSPP